MSTSSLALSVQTKKPVFRLPPFKVEEVFTTRAETVDWGLTLFGVPSLWGATRGEGIKVAVLDTGVALNHPDLKDAILKTKDFTRSRSRETDVQGHGCVAPWDMLYTSLHGIGSAEELFRSAPGVAHFRPDGAVIKDVSSYDIRTVSADDGGQSVAAKVLAVHKLHHKGKVHKVKTREGDLTLTPWHPVYTVRSRTGKEVIRITKKRADELAVGDYVLLAGVGPDIGRSESVPWKRRWNCQFCRYSARAGNRKQCRQCDKQSWHTGATENRLPIDEDVAYFVGMVIADGHLTKLQKQIEFTNTDEQQGERFCELSERLFGKRPVRYRYKRRAVSWRLNDADVYDLLAAIGIPVGKKSLTVKVPPVITRAPRRVVSAFAAGLLEGDGNVRSRLRLGSGSRDFVVGMRMLLQTLGIRSSYSVAASTKGDGNPYYMLRIGGDRQLCAAVAVKDTSGVRPAKRRIAATVTEIAVEDYDGPMYDLTVEGTHNYVANGHIVSNTHCAGIIAARENSSGVVGVAPKAGLLIGKVLGDNGSGSTDGIAAGIRWAVSQGADVISMSLGSPNGDDLLEKAVAEAIAAGVVVICAAGNEGPRPNTVGFPAQYPGVISVAAINSAKSVARFSSRGTRIDVAAPGENILSCYPPNTLAKLSGTSMACPFVAGIAALALAADRLEGQKTIVTSADLLQILQEVAIDAGAPGKDTSYGWGLINPKGILDRIHATPRAGEPDGPPAGGVLLGPDDLSDAGLAKVVAFLGRSLDAPIAFKAA